MKAKFKEKKYKKLFAKIGISPSKLWIVFLVYESFTIC